MNKLAGKEEEARTTWVGNPKKGKGKRKRKRKKEGE